MQGSVGLLTSKNSAIRAYPEDFQKTLLVNGYLPFDSVFRRHVSPLIGLLGHGENFKKKGKQLDREVRNVKQCKKQMRPCIPNRRIILP